MKIKNIILVLSIALMFLLCIGSISASDDNTTIGVDSDDKLMQEEIEPVYENESYSETTQSNETGIDDTSNSTANENSSQVSENPTTTTPPKNVSKKTINAFCTNAFIQKSNKYFTVKLFTFNEKANKLNYYKNVKITVKVKIGSKIKTYNVKTNSKGEAKIFNIKNLKVGLYTLTITSNDEKYTIKEKKGHIGIFTKKQKTVTLKMNTRKKIKNGYIDVFSMTKNSQYPKGVYVDEYHAKNPQNKPSKLFITKAKYFFKNKKTGKIISKTIKTKASSIYGWDYPQHKLIKGYKPLKATVWYAWY